MRSKETLYAALLAIIAASLLFLAIRSLGWQDEPIFGGTAIVGANPVQVIEVSNAQGVVTLRITGEPTPFLEVRDSRGRWQKLDLANLANKLPRWLDPAENPN